MRPPLKKLSTALVSVAVVLMFTAPAALAVLVHDATDLSGPEEAVTGEPMEAIAPDDDGLRYVTRSVRAQTGVSFEGFGWAAGPRMTIVRDEALAGYADPAAAAWDRALPGVDVSVRAGDGCAWRELADGEVGVCRRDVPYTPGRTWDGTTDVAADADRGIHKARVRLNFFSAVLEESDDLSVGMVVHEIGHAFGLRHPEAGRQCGSIMSFCFDRTDPSYLDADEARERMRAADGG